MITEETPATANVLLTNGTTTVISSATTVNSVFLQGSQAKTSTYLRGEGTLKVTSGVVVLGYHRNAAPFVQCSVDFGDHQGVISFARGKGSNWNGSIHGTAGAIFFQTSDSAASDSGGTGLVVAGDAVKNSMLTGDVIVHGKVDSSVHQIVPGGADRPGDIYAHGYVNIAGGEFNAIYGIGYFYRENGTMTIGCDDRDGDLKGAFISSTTIVKVGSGRQRVAGESTHTKSTSVEAGVLQNDGSFTASAVTVKAGATLAGSGSFAQLVTLEYGAHLEAGSTDTEDDTVMELDGGLKLAGGATLDLVARGRETVCGAYVGGAFSIPEESVIQVNVLLDEGMELKRGITHTILVSETPLVVKNFRRGANCGSLRLSTDRTALLMTAFEGLKIVVR